jgi:hypothetical protein
MDTGKKVITRLPLDEVWNDKGNLNAQCVVTGLNAADVTEMIKAGATFVVADVGLPPRWINPAHRFEFRKTEVKPGLAEADESVFLERFPGGYCYFASKWRLPDELSLIVLERHH